MREVHHHVRLAAYLATSASLTSADFGWNNLGAEDAKALAPAIAGSASLTSVNLAHNNLAGKTGYVKASEVQGSSFEVGNKVIYQGREMLLSQGKDRAGEIKMKPLDWQSGINAIADALRVSASLTKVISSALAAPCPCCD